MKVIELTKGKVAIVDDEDFDAIAQYRWRCVEGPRTTYAGRNISVNGKQKGLYLHHALVKPPSGMEVDHINGNGLDNRRSNLRFATRAQNQWNARTRKDNKAGAKGVSFHKGTRKFVAQISFNKQRAHLGYFDTVVAAKAAYDAVANQQRGEFARLN